MTRAVAVSTLLALVAACDSVDERPACRRSADCAAGQTCAVTPDGNVCWPDTSPPAVTAVTLTCDGDPCRRDGTLHVEATVTDDHEVASAEVALDLEPGRAVPLARSGASWVADLPLRDFPFEAFERPVVAAVTATDGARTRSAPRSSEGVGVTRLRWEYTAPNALTAPAVMEDGTVVVGVAGTVDQLLAVSAVGTKAWSRTVGAQAVTAAPAIGMQGIWVAGQDGVLTVAGLDGTAGPPSGSVQSDGPIDGAVAIAVLGDQEWGVAGSRSGRIVAVNALGTNGRSVAGLPLLFGPVVASTGRVCSVTTVVSCFPFDGAFGAPSDVNLGAGVSGAMIADRGGFVWVLTAPPGRIVRTASTGGDAEPVASLPAGTFSDSLVVLPGGDLVVGDVGNRLHRFAPDGTERWTSPPELSGIPGSSLVMTTGSAGAIVVGTSSGTLAAVGGEGQIHWERSLGTAPLRAPNIHTPPGQPAGKVLSTAYVSSASGKLYAVIVDGELDTSSPWPKAFHDPRNTNNAGTLP